MKYTSKNVSNYIYRCRIHDLEAIELFIWINVVHVFNFVSNVVLLIWNSKVWKNHLWNHTNKQYKSFMVGAYNICCISHIVDIVKTVSCVLLITILN
jgi:hypothetical protein